MQEGQERGRKDEKDEEKGAHGRITLGRTEKGPMETLPSSKPAVYAAIITGERRERYVALR